MSIGDRFRPEVPGIEQELEGSEERYHEMGSDTEVFIQKEGLPESFQMRHDEHYVEALIASGRVPRLRVVSVEEIEGALPGDGEKLEGLVDSIQEFGVLQPLLVRRDRGRFEVLSGARRLAAAVAAGLREVPCLVHEVDDVEARRLSEAANRSGAAPAFPAPTRQLWGSSAASLVEQSLQTILSALPLLERAAQPLRDRVAVGLIRAEALRAGRFLSGLRLLASDPPVARREVDLAAILRGVLAVTEEERGLLRIELETSIEEPCRLRADAELAEMAVWGAVAAILSTLRDSRGAAMWVRLSAAELGGGVRLVVSEDSVRMPTSSWSRWLELNWEERPGGYGAAVSLLAAKRAAELHGGRLDVTPTDTGGCQVGVLLSDGRS